MKYKIITLVFLTFLLNLANANEIQQIQEKGFITIAMPQKDAVPFYYVDAQGDLQGIDIELAKGIANILGVEARFNRDAKTFSQVVDLVENKTVDIALCKLSITMSRLSKVSFTDSYIDLHHALIVNRHLLAKKSANDTKSNAIRNFDGSIGVIGGSSYDEYAQFQFPDADVVGLNGWATVTEQLIQGLVPEIANAPVLSVDAAYRDEVEVRLFMLNDKKHAVNFISVLLTDSLDRKGIAVHHDNLALKTVLNHYLKNLNLNLTADKVLDNKDANPDNKNCSDGQISKECPAKIIDSISRQVTLLTGNIPKVEVETHSNEEGETK